MGICYEIFILDEFDWDYVNWDRNKTIEEVKKVCPYAKLKGDCYGMLIFDVDKTWPGSFIGNVKMDTLYYRGDNNLLKIEKFYKEEK